MPSGPRKTRIDWQAAPEVYIPLPPRPACPACGSFDPPDIRRSENQGDGSTLRRCICRACGAPFRLIVDPDISTDWNLADSDLVDSGQQNHRRQSA